MCIRDSLGQRLRSAPADFDSRRRFASVHSASDSTPTHCSSGPFYRSAYSTLVSTSIHSTRVAMDAMDASGTDSVPVVCRRKTGGRCRSRPRGSSWSSHSVAAAALACLVTFSLMGQAHAAYSCYTTADCNYDGCANRACSGSSSYSAYCNNGVWDYGCVSTL